MNQNEPIVPKKYDDQMYHDIYSYGYLDGWKARSELKYKCLRCEGEWHPQVDNPKACPHCHSPYWNKPKEKFPKTG